MWRSRWRYVIKPAYSVSFLLSINIFVWQNVLYFLDAPRINLTSWCKFLLQKLIFFRLLEKLPCFMGPKCSVPCSQEPVTGEDTFTQKDKSDVPCPSKRINWQKKRITDVPWHLWLFRAKRQITGLITNIFIRITLRPLIKQRRSIFFPDSSLKIAFLFKRALQKLPIKDYEDIRRHNLHTS